MTEYNKAMARIAKLNAQVEREEAKSVSLPGTPYNLDEIDYWKDWHLQQAERFEELADDFLN